MKKFMTIAICLMIVTLLALSNAFTSSFNETIYQSQKRLKGLGYNPGPVDGFWGKKTKKALEQFQHDNGLPVSGKLDRRTKEKLGLQKATQRATEPAPVYSDTRGLKISALDRSTGQQKEIKLYNKSYAVIIGIDQYKNLPFDMQLSYAVHDAKGVAEALRKNFKFDKIITIYNKEANRDNILRVLSGDLSKISKNDSVFIFWAGHGYTQKTDYGDLGYLIPFDGTFNESELYKNISMTMIKDDISKRIPAKHIFFVMDACYSGLLVTKRGAVRKTARDLAYIKEITKENVRQVLAAGNKDQEVLDGGPRGHSVFTGRFIEILENTDDYITAAEISNMVKERVFSDARARGHIQTPQYGELFGLGDYVFVPSLEQKVEDTQAELAKLQNEKRRLEKLEKEALKAKDEMARRQAELEKRAIEAKLLAEKLKQERLSAEKLRREKEQVERIRREQELVKKKEETESRLTALKQEVETKRKTMADSDIQLLSPDATIREMRDIDAKIKEIQSAYRNELANAIVMISNQVNDKFKKAVSAKKNEFESESEFQARVRRMKKDAGQEQSKRFAGMIKKIEDAYNKETAPFINTLKDLSGQEFTLMAQDLILELHQYNAKFNTYPVTIKAKNPIHGIIISCSSNIPISRDEARIFKPHFKNNILRPEISGNFQSREFFRITKAYVIDDATNKRYDLFTSKFVDLGNGIVYDNVTKLLWLKDANYFKKSFGAGLYGIGEKDAKDASKVCENLNMSGLYGWRLPKSDNLKRMYSAFHDQEPHPFNGMVERGSYWVSLQEQQIKDYKRYKRGVDLKNRAYHYCGGGKIACEFYAWPVRNSSFDNLAFNREYGLFTSKFVDLGNGIVYDNVTKLLWLKDANYFKKSFGAGLYRIGEKDAKDASKVCENLNMLGLYGWRLPKSDNLKRMYSAFHDQEPHPFIGMVERGSYWVSLQEEQQTQSYMRYKRGVDLKSRAYDYCGGGEISCEFYVWPVRGSE